MTVDVDCWVSLAWQAPLSVFTHYKVSDWLLYLNPLPWLVIRLYQITVFSSFICQNTNYLTLILTSTTKSLWAAQTKKETACKLMELHVSSLNFLKVSYGKRHQGFYWHKWRAQFIEAFGLFNLHQQTRQDWLYSYLMSGWLQDDVRLTSVWRWADFRIIK